MNHLYHKEDDRAAVQNVGSKAVVEWQDGVIFRCPCDERQCYIAKNHSITFLDNGVLTLHPSIGYHENKEMGRPQNWCHFWLEGGQAAMCGDAKCPGGDGSIP